MKIKYVQLIFIFFSIIFVSQAQISLEDCINSAEKNTPQAQLLPLIKEAEALQIKALNKNLLPQASLGGQATWQSVVTGLPIKFPGVEVPSIPKDQYKATLDFNQTLWDGGQLKSQKSLTLANSFAETKNVETNIYQIREQVANLYFGAVLASNQFQLSQININDIQSNLKRVKANVENGTAINSNVLALEAKLLEINQLQTEIKSRKLAALKGLSILTGQNITENTVLNQPDADFQKVNLDLVTQNITLKRPELNFFEAQKAIVDANKAVSNSKYAPRVNLFGTGGYGRPGLNFLSPDFATYFIGGVSLKIPISQLYTKSKAIDYLLIDVNKSKIDKQKEGFIQQVNMKLSSLHEEFVKLQTQINDDKKLIEIRTQIKKSAQNRLDNGVITVSEFLTELDNESVAKQNMILHQIQLMQVINAIEIAKGN